MDLIFWAMHQHRANGVQAVVVTAAERTCSCFRYLEEKEDLFNITNDICAECVTIMLAINKGDVCCRL